MHDKAGPLRPSSTLLDAVRLCRALRQLSETLDDENARRALLDDTIGKANAKLSLPGVRDVEEQLGATIPDDILYVIASKNPFLATASGLSMETLLDVAEDHADDVPKDHIAVAMVYSDPFAEKYEDAEGGDYEILAIPRNATKKTEEILVIEDRGEPEKTTLGTFIRDKISSFWGERHGEMWLSVRTLEGRLPLELETNEKASLDGEIRPSKPVEVRFVVHPKFGKGKVLDTVHDGSEKKLVIEFGNPHGKKTLIERFVRDA